MNESFVVQAKKPANENCGKFPSEIIVIVIWNSFDDDRNNKRAVQ